eukprot:132151_1
MYQMDNGTISRQSLSKLSKIQLMEKCKGHNIKIQFNATKDEMVSCFLSKMQIYPLRVAHNQVNHALIISYWFRIENTLIPNEIISIVSEYCVDERIIFWRKYGALHTPKIEFKLIHDSESLILYSNGRYEYSYGLWGTMQYRKVGISKHCGLWVVELADDEDECKLILNGFGFRNADPKSISHEPHQQEISTEIPLDDQLFNSLTRRKSSETASKAALEKAERLKQAIEKIKRQRLKYSRARRKRVAELEMQIQSGDQLQIQRTAQKKIKSSDFTVVKVIEKGAFDEVRIVRHNGTNKVLVMKTMRKKLMIAKSPDKWAEEGESKWFVKQHYSFQDATYLYFVMEYCSGGDMRSLLVKWDVLTEKQTQFYISELNEAIHAIHELGFVYCDLKPSHILITEGGHIKLSDVRFRQKFRIKDGKQTFIWEWQEKGDALEEQSTVVMDYTAPEMLGQKGYDQMVDYWSIGVIMFECLIGYAPFRASNPLQTCRKIVHYKEHLKVPIDVKLSKECLDLMHNLVCSHRRRFGYDLIKKHMFFKKQ